MDWGISKIGKKSTFLTTVLLITQLAVLVLPACYTNPEFDDNLCGITRRANVTEISQVFFSPFIDGIYADENDTVQIEDFRFNFELEFESLQSSASGFLGQCFALDCEPKFDVQNISNILILLSQDFLGFPPGTDVSFLFKFSDGTLLNRLRDFSQVGQFYSLTFQGEINATERMHTNMIVFLKNGEQLKFNSVSPYLKN